MRPSRHLVALITCALVGALLVFTAQPSSAVSDKGRGIASRMPDLDNAGDVDHIKDLKAGWTYAWRYRNIPDSSDELDVVPMIRTESSLLVDTVDYLSQKRTQGKFKYLLGFNEPDNPNQANMKPAEAAALWPKLQDTGLILGSPAVAHPDNGWLKSFMTLVGQKKLKVNFIALHYYFRPTEDPVAAAARIKKSIQSVHNAYNRPIWVTEIGITDSRTKNIGSAATNWVKAANIMRSVNKTLDTLPYVQRYAWVADQTNDYKTLKWSGLYTDKTFSKQTALGKVFLSFFGN